MSSLCQHLYTFVEEEKQNFLGKKFVKTVRNQKPKTNLIEINPKKLLEVA